MGNYYGNQNQQMMMANGSNQQPGNAGILPPAVFDENGNPITLLTTADGSPVLAPDGTPILVRQQQSTSSQSSPIQQRASYSSGGLFIPMNVGTTPSAGMPSASGGSSAGN